MSRGAKKIVLCLLCLLIFTQSSLVWAEVPYKTHYFDAQGRMIPIQPIYLPADIIEYSFSEPIDVFVAASDHVYVVDRKLNAVFEFDPQLQLVRKYGDEQGEGSLDTPQGVFVDGQGKVYVADGGNERIAVFSAQGQFVQAFGKPVAPAISNDFFYVPSKVVVDDRGIMYVALNSSGQGLMRLGPEGDFRGFFGANKANPSFLGWVKRLILNKEQLAKEIANLPRPINNIGIDNKGFVLTVTTRSSSGGNIRHLNATGTDLLRNRWYSNAWDIVDVALDSNKFLYGLEQMTGKVTIYNPKGDVMFDFGSTQITAQENGRFIFPTSIGVNSAFEVFVADTGLNTVYRFKRSEFGQAALTAASLYDQGRYKESAAYWSTIAAENEMFDLTYQGLGKLALLQGDYESAMKDFKITGDVRGYSEAYWNIRIERIQQYFVGVMVALLAAFVLYRIARRPVSAALTGVAWPSSVRVYMGEMRHFFLTFFRPYQGYYRLKERKIPLAVLFTILLLVVGARLLQIYVTGFIFNPGDLSKKDVWRELAIIFVPWLSWVIASHLVSSVKGGEGRFRETIQACIYGLAPYVLLVLVIVPLSRLIVLEESILYYGLNNIMLLWLAAHFFIMNQVIHNFDFMEAIKNTATTVFTVLMIWLVCLIVIALAANLFDFFTQVYMEVT